MMFSFVIRYVFVSVETEFCEDLIRVNNMVTINLGL